jgi:hypothetical protein
MTWRPDCLIVHDDPPAYAVPSETGRAVYLVVWEADRFSCDCPDYAARGQFRDCKHCAAVAYWLLREFPNKRGGQRVRPATNSRAMEARSI